jgi:hypothetical protein
MITDIELDFENIFEDLKSIEMTDNTKELLDNGIPAYIKDPGMADGVMIKLYPNGTRKIVKIDSFFNERVIG